ncbi:MAG: hypothetical protein HKP55_08560 [Gammaproteobacteria bacterium]|nr:hypothetical protein [Gammaproteobacteria bacterium]NNJ91711.1 hypothetical protein [Gammaproteobacteria bacterium]
MKTLLATLLLVVSSALSAQTVFLNIPAESESVPAMTIPTASQDSCERLMNKLSREKDSNFYLSCSIVPFDGRK